MVFAAAVDGFARAREAVRGISGDETLARHFCEAGLLGRVATLCMACMIRAGMLPLACL